MAKLKHSLNSTLSTALANRARPGKLQHARREFSQIAIANKIEVSEGFTTIASREFIARKSTPNDALVDDLLHDHAILHGNHRGSLSYFLVAYHALGFRLFSKSNEALQFIAADILHPADLAYKQTLSASKLMLPECSPSTIYLAMTAQFRGKGTKTDVDLLIVRLRQYLVGKTAKVDDYTLDVIAGLASALTAQYPTFKALNTDPIGAAGVTDEYLSRYTDKTVNSVTAITAYCDLKAKRQDDLQSSTMAFDHTFEDLYQEDYSSNLIAIIGRYAKHVYQANPKAKMAASVQHLVTTNNGTGLQFLFGKGIKLLAQEKIQVLRSLLDVPASKVSRLKTLIKLAKELDYRGSIGKNALQNSRTATQSMLDAAIANHVNRLTESVAMLAKHAQVQISVPTLSASQLSDADTTIESLTQYVDAIGPACEALMASANVLLGKTHSQPILEAKKQYEQARLVLSRATTYIKALNARLSQKQLPHVALPQDWILPVSLPRFRAPVLDITADRAHIEQECQHLVDEYLDVTQALLTKHDATFEKALDNEARLQQQAFDSGVKKRNALSNPEIAARRYFLSLVFRMVSRANTALKKEYWKVLSALNIAEQQHLKEHLFSGQHFCWVSPRDTKLKKLIKIDEAALLALDFETLFRRLKECTAFTDDSFIELVKLKTRLLQKALPLRISIEDIDRPLLKLNANDGMAHLLTQTFADRQDVVKLINNTYHTKINSMAYRLSHKQFMDSAVFVVYPKNGLYFVPKRTRFNMASNLQRKYSALLSTLDIRPDTDGKFCAMDTASKLANHTSELDKVARNILLKQVPHRWFVQTDLKDFGVSEPLAIQMSYGDVKYAGSKTSLVQIQWSSKSNQVAIDDLYGQFQTTKATPLHLKLQRHFTVNDGNVIERKDRRQLVFSIPFFKQTESAHREWAPSHVLGIDHGKFGAGLGLVNINDGDIEDAAVIRIPEIEAYVKTVEMHRKSSSPRQLYKRHYSNHAAMAKQSAVKAAASIIDNVILQLNAIPVFEHITTAKNAVEDVWLAVSKLYCWGDNDNQNAIRKHHWNGGSRWLLTHVNRETNEPLVVFPGGSISGANTSQTCPHCKRNPIALVKSLIESNPDDITIQEGRLELPEGSLVLSGPDSHSSEKNKLKGFNPTWRGIGSKSFEYPTLNNLSGKELLNLVRRSIRRPNKALSAKESLQSHYVCAFQDCLTSGSSEAFAAINIARKWVVKNTQSC